MSGTWLLALALLAPGQVAESPSSAGELVVFVAPSTSAVGRDFQDRLLPRLRARAEKAAMPLRVVNVEEGAPEEVTITPLIFHQSWRGRSIYQGRTVNEERLGAFLRTSAFVAQEDSSWTRTRLPVRRVGRAKIAMPLKITELTGALPEDHDAEAFTSRARTAVLAGLEEFEEEAQVEFLRTDRAFYLDLHPYRGEDDTLHLSAELFSSFHCKEPIWRLAEPLSGPFAEWARLFAEAARLAEFAIAERMAETRTGDGFDPVPIRVPVLSWDALGLELPARPETRSGERGGEVPELGREWRFRITPPAELEPPGASSIRFHFPPPLDSTAGEVLDARGQLVLGEGATLEGARGDVVCRTDSVTLGWSDLDDTVRGESILAAEQHPEASFFLDEVVPEKDGRGGLLEFGRPTQAEARGRFVLRGQSVPLGVRASFEPVLGRNGELRLRVEASYQLRLKEPFGITGPDGPSPQRDTLLFDLSLELSQD